MRLADVLDEDCITVNLQSKDKSEVLSEIVTGFASKLEGVEVSVVVKALLERERLGTTGIGHGVAIPHGRIKGLGAIKVFFGRSQKGVEYESMDRLPVHIFFLIVAPENSASAHLKLLASISHLLKYPEIRLKLIRAADTAEVYRTIIEAERKLGSF